MWSYYGNGHSGICLELDLTAYRHALVRVEYLKDLASIEHASAKDQPRFKAQHWVHEEEYRLVFGPDERRKYIRAEIRSVLIGAAIKQDYIRPLFELCRLMHYQKEIVSFSTSGEFARVPLNRDIPWDPSQDG